MTVGNRIFRQVDPARYFLLNPLHFPLNLRDNVFHRYLWIVMQLVSESLISLEGGPFVERQQTGRRLLLYVAWPNKARPKGN